MFHHINSIFHLITKVSNFVFIHPKTVGWDHMKSPQTMNLHAVRLCFQVFFMNGKQGKCSYRPIISNPIKDKKKSGRPKIQEISTTSSSVFGGDRIMIFCDKVQKDDIQIIFYEEDSHWKHEVVPDKVHHQVGIVFKTPPYKDLDIYEVKKVYMKLYRPSDKEASDGIPFEYIPSEKSKKKKLNLKKKLKSFFSGLHNTFSSIQAYNYGAKDKRKSENQSLEP